MQIEDGRAALESKDIKSNVLNGEVIKSMTSGRLFIKGALGIACLEDGHYISFSNIADNGNWLLVKAKVVVTHQ